MSFLSRKKASGHNPTSSNSVPTPSLSLHTSEGASIIEPISPPTISDPPQTFSSPPVVPRTSLDSDLDIITHQDANISSGHYARKCKELLELNSDLRNMGAGTLIDLPRIAVIGSQSAGKSSLVEAVSGINVPRDSGTCTRCPMECTMLSAAETWSCTISLRMDFDNSGHELSTSQRIDFGPPLTDKDEVDLWLRRAQTAVLCPHLPHDLFLTKSREDLRDSAKDRQILKFSKNAVCVTIRDPDATDLSFVDLPGLIQNEEQDMINLVRDLVVQYIKGEKTLILITIPMSDDMENQQAVRLARETDPAGTRTIGVLTKPDTITKGAMNARFRWLRVIEGNAHKLTNGYYCVRLPDDDERQRKIPRAESLRLASEFFSSTAPWNEVADRSHFGIPNFVSDISKLLVSLIETTLPDLKKDVKNLISACQQELNALPAPIAVDASTEVISRITRFCAEVQGAVYGKEDQLKTLVQSNRARYAEFKRDIRETAPDFRPFVSASSHCRPQIAGREEDDISTDSPIGLLHVREVIRNSIAWELPHNVPFEAKKVLVQRFTECWTEPAERCFDEVYEVLVKTLENLMQRNLGRFFKLHEVIGAMTRDVVLDCREDAMKSIERCLALERFPLFTQNVHHLESERDRWLAHFRFAHTHSHTFPPSPTPVRLASTRPSGLKKKKGGRASPGLPIGPEPDNACDLPDQCSITSNEPFYPPPPSARPQPVNTYDEELVVMAEVRAYFQVAYKRIIDYLPLTIEHSLNQALADGLQAILLAGLLSGDVEERMEELVSEDPAVAKERERLLARKRRLVQIKAKLDEFPLAS